MKLNTHSDARSPAQSLRQSTFTHSITSHLKKCLFAKKKTRNFQIENPSLFEHDVHNVNDDEDNNCVMATATKNMNYNTKSNHK